MASMQVEKPQRQVYGKMSNQTSTEMICERYIDFSGTPTPGPLLPPIPAGETLFVDRVVSKGAVVYAGGNKEHLPSAWVLAWDAPLSPSPTKVYVTCGPKSVIDKMTPDEIQKNLDTKGSEFSLATDQILKITANAVIVGAVPDDSANVSANFGLIP